ncbi:hypothetical protein RSAG8_09297, partial [Rhizoctonia solani AG-8 WAC10335]
MLGFSFLPYIHFHLAQMLGCQPHSKTSYPKHNPYALAPTTPSTGGALISTDLPGNTPGHSYPFIQGRDQSIQRQNPGHCRYHFPPHFPSEHRGTQTTRIWS